MTETTSPSGGLRGDVLDVSVPHQLGKDEAKRRVRDGVGRITTGSLPMTVAETWQGDRLEFTLTAMGQSINGWADVNDSRVDFHVKLPWLLAKLADKLRPQLEQKARDVLKLPPGNDSGGKRS